MNEAPLQHLTDALLQIIRTATARMLDIADRNGGEMDAASIAAWRDSVANALIEYHTAAMIAGGGGDTLDPKLQGQLSEIVANQLNYLDNFAEAVATGNLTPAQISARAKPLPA